MDNRRVVTALAAGGLTIPMLTVIAMAWIREPARAQVAASVNRGLTEGKTKSCPLTQAQQEKSVAAWNKLMPVFRHPRCANCHGAIPRALPEAIRVNGRNAAGPAVRHVGVVDMDSTDNNRTCEQCHMDDWGGALGAPKWSDKTDEDICRGMHIVFEENAPGFIDHIVRDGGNTQFIEAAYKGLRGLTEGGRTIYENETGKTIIPEPPPGTHAQLIAQARAWVAAQGGKFVGDKDCGCVVAETGEVYLLSIQLYNLLGAGGAIVVTDSVTMKIRIADTTVTVYALKNFLPSAVPSHVTYPQETVKWVIDPIGHMNIATAVGHLAVDYPSDGVRTLMVEFTHKDTHYPTFETIYKNGGTGREGGQAYQGFPGGSSFQLVDGKTLYEVKNRTGIFRLTLLSSTR
jgi:hypothetical protein